MKVKSGPIVWRILDEDEYSIGEESRVDFISFLGKNRTELNKAGFDISVDPNLLTIHDGGKKPEFNYADTYKNGEKVPFSGALEEGDITFWYDPMRSQLIATLGEKYDFTFYRRAVGLFKAPGDLADGFNLLTKSLHECDVDRYYLLVEQSSSGKYTVTIGRHRDKPKHERKYRFFAGSILEFFTTIRKCFDDFIKAFGIYDMDETIQEKDKTDEFEKG